MFFYEFEKYKDAKLDKRLLWEFEVEESFDYNSVKRLVVQRVIQLGGKEDYYTIFKMFGGIDGVREIIKEIDFLSKKDMNFVSVIFKIKMEELKCYKKMLSLKKPIMY